MSKYYISIDYSDSLCHHGILGQKWGVRRYQNEDGSLTPLGKIRYRTSENLEKHKPEIEERAKKKEENEKIRKALSEKKKQEAKEAAEKKAREDKESAIASGNPEKIMKYASGMSNEELRSALDRARTISNINSMIKQNPTIREKLGNFATDYAKKALMSMLEDDDRDNSNSYGKYTNSFLNTMNKSADKAAADAVNKARRNGMSEEDAVREGARVHANYMRSAMKYASDAYSDSKKKSKKSKNKYNDGSQTIGEFMNDKNWVKWNKKNFKDNIKTMAMLYDVPNYSYNSDTSEDDDDEKKKKKGS